MARSLSDSDDREALPIIGRRRTWPEDRLFETYRQFLVAVEMNSRYAIIRLAAKLLSQLEEGVDEMPKQ